MYELHQIEFICKFTREFGNFGYVHRFFIFSQVGVVAVLGNLAQPYPHIAGSAKSIERF